MLQIIINICIWIHTHTHTHTYIHMHTYVYITLWVELWLLKRYSEVLALYFEYDFTWKLVLCRYKQINIRWALTQYDWWLLGSGKVDAKTNIQGERERYVMTEAETGVVKLQPEARKRQERVLPMIPMEPITGQCGFRLLDWFTW